MKLKDGDYVEIVFPDGFKLQAPIVMHDGDAHFTMDFHGHEVDCPLDGLEYRRVAYGQVLDVGSSLRAR